jgi:hypothetical protein
MENEFVPYELALRMKQLGFVKPCVAFYEVFKGDVRDVYTISSEVCERLCSDEKFVKAPTFSQVFRWFREKYNVHMVPSKYDENRWWIQWGTWTSSVFNTYEEAELACLEKLLDISEQKQK